MTQLVTTRSGDVIQEPSIIYKLFNDRRAGWIWFLLRIWLGWQWVVASEHKITSAAWVGTGEALKGYWAKAIAIPATGSAPIAYDWYRGFLTFLLNTNSYTWFAKLIAYGELLVGIGLIVGAFVGLAAFFGALMNWSFMMAGSASTNPMLFLIAVLLIVAWKVAGYIGADFFIFRYLGVPWKSKKAEKADQKASAPAPAGD